LRKNVPKSGEIVLNIIKKII